MVIFRGTDLSIAEKVSERIRLAVERHDFAEDLRVTISGGVSQYNGETMTEFIHLADLKLYAAKKNGKNQIVSAIDSSTHD